MSDESVHFVAGATGYTGRGVVAALRRRGALTWAHVRPDSSARDRWRDFFAEQGAGVDATPWTLEAMTETLGRIRPTHLYALLGTTRARADRDTGSAVPETYEAVDYGLTRLLLDASRAAGLAPVFVYLSALGAESSSSEYFVVRRRLEGEIAASGFPFLIARPSFITGADRLESRPVEKIGAAALDLVFGVLSPAIGRGAGDRWRAITGPELGEALVRLGFDQAPGNRTLDGRGLRAALRARTQTSERV